jgi:FMN phosphatase YigB (HAD superfamily)
MHTQTENPRPGAILFDVDGVIVPEGSLYFSERLSHDYDIPMDKIAPFFLNQFHGCLVGKRDIKEELTVYLRSWGWIGSVDELLYYWFEAERHTDERLIDRIQEIRHGGTPCYIASHQEKYRAEYLLARVGLDSCFDGAFFSCYIGYMKYERHYYEKVLASLDLKPENVMFWDDSLQNIGVALEFGLDARHYVSYEDFSRQIGYLKLQE